MEVNSRFISIPPLLSVSWQQVACMYMEEELLIVTLVSGTCVELSNLPSEIVEKLFSAHLAYMRRNTNTLMRLPTAPLKEISSNSAIMEEPISEHIASVRLGFSNAEGVGSALQHDPNMASAPNIPTEILLKFAAISKILAPEEIEALPKPETDCNCMHCQIVRAIHAELKNSESTLYKKRNETKTFEEEIVADEELHFQQWDVKLTGDKLFSVIDKVEPEKQYRVYLGEPMGCTCGGEGCEHVIAVLKSPII